MIFIVYLDEIDICFGRLFVKLKFGTIQSQYGRAFVWLRADISERINFIDRVNRGNRAA